MLAVADARVGSGIEEQTDDIHMTLCGGQVQRCHLGVPVAPAGVRIRTVLEQPADGLDVAALRE
jgi:hypothetical protein